MSFRLETFRPFHLPTNPLDPLLLVGAGTGFAPLRGLLQQRAHFVKRGVSVGRAVLVVGARSMEEALFEDEVMVKTFV